jgi:hypothetical protein
MLEAGEMPLSNYLPERMGSVELTPLGRFVSGTYASFTLTYTAGHFGIDDTGGIKIATRFATDMPTPQFTDPSAPSFVTAEASNGAVLELTYDVKGNVRPWDKTIRVKVVRGFLREGDRITVRIGDPRQGSPGIRVQTFAEKTFEFRVLVDAFATYDFVELANCPAIEIIAGEAVVWRAIGPTLAAVGRPIRLGIRGEDRWGNIAGMAISGLRLSASLPVRGADRVFGLPSGARALVIDDLVPEVAGDLVIRVQDEGGAMLAESNPIRVEARPRDLMHAWADLHGQSEETIGTNSAHDYFAFARDLAFLDIAAHQGNDFQITRTFYATLNEVTRTFNEPGRFITLPGYEWSGNTALGGDRNVYFATETDRIHRSSHALVGDPDDRDTDRYTAKELLATLVEVDSIVNAHVGGRYADIALAHDGRVERSVEVHSSWGTFEWLLHDALEQGFRVGITGGSDDHKGRPGASSPGASTFGAYGGLTCLLLPELTRPAVVEALRRRRHYATTGNRPFLDVHARLDSPGLLFHDDPGFSDAAPIPVSTVTMGDIIATADESVEFQVEVGASAPIERIDLMVGRDIVRQWRPHGPQDLGNRIRIRFEGAEYRGRGRQTDWSGRAEITGVEVEFARTFNFFNPDKALEREGGRLRWSALTTGNFCGFDLALSRNDGLLSLQTSLVSFDLKLAEIGYEETVFEAGGLGRRVRVWRLPDVGHTRAARLSQRIAVPESGDAPFYVRLTQEDGHQAWTSPVYLMRRR